MQRPRQFVVQTAVTSVRSFANGYPDNPMRRVPIMQVKPGHIGVKFIGERARGCKRIIHLWE